VSLTKRSAWLSLLACTHTFASPAYSQSAVKAGDAFELVQRYETSGQTNGNDTSSSGGHSTLIERVIRVDENGIELEYDVPPNDDGQPDGSNWQFPARIYRPTNGSPTLQNTAELEKRVDPWLTKSKMSREACGNVIFTWTVFKIECDPTSAIAIVEPFNLWLLNLSEGGLYSDEDALVAVPLRLKSNNQDGLVYAAELAVNPEKVKISKAETDVIVGKVLRKPKSYEDALASQADHIISGTISVTIEASSSGQITKRTNITKLRVEADGEVETTSSTVTLERRPLLETKK
jgi:hypothetical protein